MAQEEKNIDPLAKNVCVCSCQGTASPLSLVSSCQNNCHDWKKRVFEGRVREAAKKSSFLSGPATKRGGGPLGLCH